MSKLLQHKLARAKVEMKNRYLAGESVHRIAPDFGISWRQVYHHIAPLSPEEKAIHVKSSVLKQMYVKEQAAESERAKPSGPTRIADFMQGEEASNNQPE